MSYTLKATPKFPVPWNPDQFMRWAFRVRNVEFCCAGMGPLEEGLVLDSEFNVVKEYAKRDK